MRKFFTNFIINREFCEEFANFTINNMFCEEISLFRACVRGLNNYLCLTTKSFTKIIINLAYVKNVCVLKMVYLKNNFFILRYSLVYK